MALNSRFWLGYERFEDLKIVLQRLVNDIALESDPAALVRNNLKVLYNLDFLMIKSLNSNLSDLNAQLPLRKPSGRRWQRSLVPDASSSGM